MSLVHLIQNYCHYNLWANKRIANWLSGVDEPLLHTVVPSSFNTLDLTVQHMTRTEKYWRAFINSEDTAHFNWSVLPGNTAINLQALVDASTALKQQCSNYTEQDLSMVLHLHTPWAKNNLPRYEYIMHVVNHASYHRGQIITIARSVGITEGVVNTDYNIFNTPA